MRVDIPITAEISRNSRAVQYIPIGQGDNAYRFLVSLKNSGAAVEIPDSATVVLNCLKPDGTYTETVGSVKDGTAVFETASNTVAVPGTVICEMQIFDGTQLTAQKFELRVEPSIINDDVIKSTDEYGLLIALIGKVEKLPAELYPYIDAKVNDEVTEAKDELSKQLGDEVKIAVDKAKTELSGGEDYHKTIKDAYELASQKTTLAEVEAKGYLTEAEAKELIDSSLSLLLSESVGTFAMTNYVGSVSGGLRVSLEYPIEYHGWRLFVGGKEITDRLIGADEAFVTAPAILDGEPLIKFYRGDDAVLEAKAKVTVKTDKARMGKLMIMQNAEC